MGLLKKIFGIGEKTETVESSNTSLALSKSSQLSLPMLPVHSDIHNLLWIGDGEYKNYVPTPSKGSTIAVNEIKITILFGTSEEPSLIYLALPIANKIESIERPPYFPTYKDLTPAQRGVYWKLLANPYDNSIDIGYVFILYYGLERYLLTDQYEKAIDIILKLRDVHTNKSFQMYSANAVILTCLQQQRPDIVEKFMNSVDKEHEYNFSANEYMLCKYALDIPLTADEIMRMAKSFEFTKNTYINRYPELFVKTLSEKIFTKYNEHSIPWSELMTESEFNKLSSIDTPVFANVSIRDRSISIPSMFSSGIFTKKIYNLLDETHESIKKVLTDKRKKGDVVPESSKSSNNTTKKEVLSFDNNREEELLKTYNNAKKHSLEQHFALIELQDFYYKYRNLDQKYLEQCIEYCKTDIISLPEIQKEYVEKERKKLASFTWLTPQEKQKRISEITMFCGNIPAFKRLAIIYEKKKEYGRAIEICDQAIAYYTETEIPFLVDEFKERRNKLDTKL